MKFFSLFALISLIVMLPAAGQDQTVPELVEIPADELGRGTPKGSAEGFITAAEKGDLETAAEYLDLRNLRGAATDMTGVQLARRLYVIVKRATWVDVDELVNHPDGRRNDNLPDYRDSIGVILDNGMETRLLMQKIPRGDGVSIWKVSNATVSLIPRLYETYGYHPLIEDLRRSVPNVLFLGFELFKWIAVLATAVVVYLCVLVLSLVLRRFVTNADTDIGRRARRFLILPFGIWSVSLAMNAVATALGRGATVETLQRVSPLPILVTIWMLFVGLNLLRDVYVARLQSRSRPGAAVLLRPATNAVKLLVGIAAALVYLDNLGVNITTVLAGLGFGGVAVALALQKPMEDVFGAITLYTQQPVRVGDFCRIGDETGTIEEIGLRTTRIRTLANTLIAIPNARLANEAIDNISARSKILFRPTLRLRYDTTPEQLREVLQGIRVYLDGHERIEQGSHRVRFKEIGDDALLVEVYAYVQTKDWREYLELAESLNMRILEIVASAETTLSLPARALHIERRDVAAPAAAASFDEAGL